MHADPSLDAVSLSNPPSHRLARQVGLFDATMVVMGGIVGAGIFINPYVVAQQVHTPLLVLAAWAVGASSLCWAHSSMPNLPTACLKSADSTPICARPITPPLAFSTDGSCSWWFRPGA